MKKIITATKESGGEQIDATALLRRLANEFSLSKKDLDCVITKALTSREIDLFASLFLCLSCEKLQIPPNSHELYVGKIMDSGFEISLEDFSSAVKELKDQELYPLFCQASAVDLFRTYRPFIQKELGLEEDGLRKTEEILLMVEEKEALGGRKRPVSIIFGALYIALIIVGDRRTQRDLRSISGLLEATIRENYKYLVGKLDLEILL
ncbi:MAG: hypothetical protein KAQ64_01350 [Candidatus Pacebacteria bacterium]|nr:hypothetical protein [Candidatus Paceibacterota bacterium]